MLDHSSDQSPDRDPLSEVLQDLRPYGVAYGHCLLTRPWGVEMEAEPAARLHLVVEGSPFLRMPNGKWTRLGQGDVVFLPRGLRHALADHPDRAIRPLTDFPREEISDQTYRLSAGGGGSRTIMACCSVRFNEPTLHPLLNLMPPILLVRQATVSDPTLPALLDAMAAEVIGQRIGAATILTRLADVVITRVVRMWAEHRHDDTTGWLAAITDPKIGRVLAAIHRRPTIWWTVDSLARAAGMSRSMFCERFSAIMGLAPGRYVAQWRMRIASVWLSRERVTVAIAAERLGYESEAAFSRAFKRVVGIPPSSLKRSGVLTDREGVAAL
jgi:AraC-like DNA-binding protein